jgi:hypothetical protein
MSNNTDLFSYIKIALDLHGYRSVASFARDSGFNEEQLRKYIRGEQKFDLHYFMALVEALELDASDLYLHVYQNEKKNGLI